MAISCDCVQNDNLWLQKHVNVNREERNRARQENQMLLYK